MKSSSMTAFALYALTIGLCLSCTSNGPAPRRAGAAPAQGVEEPASRQFRAWLEAFNLGDRAGLVAYHGRNFPYEVASSDVGTIDRELELSGGTGGFDLRKDERSTETTFVGLLQERNSDQLARATMEVDAAEPHRVRRFEIHPVPTPDELRVKRMGQAEAIEALRARLDGLLAADRFAGAVLVAK